MTNRRALLIVTGTLLVGAGVAAFRTSTVSLDRGLYLYVAGLLPALGLSWLASKAETLRESSWQLLWGWPLGLIAEILAVSLGVGLAQYWFLVAFLALALGAALTCAARMATVPEWRVSVRYVVFSFVVALFGTDAIGSFGALPHAVHATLAQIGPLFRDLRPPSFQPMEPVILPFAWFHDQRLHISKDVLYVVAGAVLTVMTVWLSLTGRRTRLSNEERQAPEAMVAGLWMTVLGCQVSVIGIGAGIPQYAPLLFFIALVTLQAGITTMLLPRLLVWLNNERAKAGSSEWAADAG